MYVYKKYVVYKLHIKYVVYMYKKMLQTVKKMDCLFSGWRLVQKGKISEEWREFLFLFD